MQKAFNAVIEGTEADDWRNFNFKITRLDIPENATVIDDRVYRYTLYGRTTDFKSIELAKKQQAGLETKVDFLGFCEGATLPYHGGIFPNVLGRPRTVVLQDGRVFTEMGDDEYRKALPEIVKVAGEIFNDERAKNVYERGTVKG